MEEWFGKVTMDSSFKDFRLEDRVESVHICRDALESTIQRDVEKRGQQKLAIAHVPTMKGEVAPFLVGCV